MREFDVAYLDWTRQGMWTETRAALEPLAVASRDRILDVGSGSGHFTAVLRAESGEQTTVIDVDFDRSVLLAGSDRGGRQLQAAARSLPLRRESIDLVTCQALLVNLTDPIPVLREFGRVSSGHVAAIEPDNSAVVRRSTVPDEARIDRHARTTFVDAADTDLAPGPGGLQTMFADAGLSTLQHRRYHHVKRIEPPYDDAIVTAAHRKATGIALDDRRETLISGSMTPAEYDDLKADWRRIGREMAVQMQEGTYRRQEVVPFDIVIGRV